MQTEAELPEITTATVQHDLPSDTTEQHNMQADPNTQAGAALSVSTPQEQPAPAPTEPVGKGTAARNRNRNGKRLKLAYWNGTTLPTYLIGMAFEFQPMPDKQAVKLHRIVVSDGIIVVMLKPGSLKRFLLQHSGHKIAILDWQLPFRALARLMSECRGVTIEQMVGMVATVLDLPSILAAMPYTRDDASFWIKKSDGMCLPELNLARLIQLVSEHNDKESIGHATLMKFLRAAQGDATDACYRLAVEAITTRLTLAWSLGELKTMPSVVEQADRYRNALTKPIYSAIEERQIKRTRAAYYRWRFCRRSRY